MLQPIKLCKLLNHISLMSVKYKLGARNSLENIFIVDRFSFFVCVYVSVRARANEKVLSLCTCIDL